MRTLNALMLAASLTVSAAGFAQSVPTTPTSPTQPQSVPAQNPATTSPESTNPTTEKKAGFNSPQSPVKPSNTPSEDTLIKNQGVSGAIMKDTLMPGSNRKGDKMSRRKSKKAENDTDTTSSSGTAGGASKRP